MRKQMIAILVIIAVFLLQGNSKPSVDGVLLKHTKLYTKMKLKSGKYLSNIIVLPHSSNYDIEEVKKITLRLDRLPSTMLKKVSSSGIKIKLFQGNLTDNPSAAYLKGITPRGYQNNSTTWDQVPGIGGSKIVLVKIGYSEKGKGHGSVDLELHELAHSLDRYLYHAENKNSIFQSIWKAEVTKLYPKQSYFIDFPEEYFAECFAMYYYNDETRNVLKRAAPKTYTYISSLK